MKQRVLVIDLDGTLYSINTFHYFIRYIIRFCLRNLKLRTLAVILLAGFLRGFKLITHARMKFLILRAVMHISHIDYEKFAKIITSKKRDFRQLENEQF